MDVSGADALFLSCTALPALNIIDKLEKIGKNKSVSGFGRLFNSN